MILLLLCHRAWLIKLTLQNEEVCFYWNGMTFMFFYQMWRLEGTFRSWVCQASGAQCVWEGRLESLGNSMTTGVVPTTRPPQPESMKFNVVTTSPKATWRDCAEQPSTKSRKARTAFPQSTGFSFCRLAFGRVTAFSWPPVAADSRASWGRCSCPFVGSQFLSECKEGIRFLKMK